MIKCHGKYITQIFIMKKIKFKSLIRRLGLIFSKLASNFIKYRSYKDILRAHALITLNDKIRFPGYGLWLSTENFKSYGFYIKVDPTDIKKQTKHGHVPFLDNSDWSNYSTDFVPHKSISEMLQQNIPWNKTTQYAHMCQQIQLGKKAYSCKTIEEVDNYDKVMIRSWNNIKENGYKIQGFKDGIYPDDIIVSINNNFEIFLERNGTHRLTLAKYLGLKEVYVFVVRLPTELYRELNENEHSIIHSI